MRPTCLLIAALSFMPIGCGTMMNVTAQPGPSTGLQIAGPTACEPFGGVRRSMLGGSMLAFGGNPVGVVAATVAVGVDTPLSLVGDVVTLLYVMARNRGDAWASAGVEPRTRRESEAPREVPPAPPVISPIAPAARSTEPNAIRVDGPAPPLESKR